MNKAIIIGRLTKDIELRYTQGGTAVGGFTMAVDRQYKNKDGEKETDFIPVVVWGKIAENCSKYIGKGSLVATCGRIQTRNYEDKDKIKRYVTEIVAEEVMFLNTSKNNNEKEDLGSMQDELYEFDDFPESDDVPF